MILKKGTEEYAVWSDVVKVAPGQETFNDDILITQDIIGTKPEKLNFPDYYILILDSIHNHNH